MNFPFLIIISKAGQDLLPLSFEAPWLIKGMSLSPSKNSIHKGIPSLAAISLFVTKTDTLSHKRARFKTLRSFPVLSPS